MRQPIKKQREQIVAMAGKIACQRCGREAVGGHTKCAAHLAEARGAVKSSNLERKIQNDPYLKVKDAEEFVYLQWREGLLPDEMCADAKKMSIFKKVKARLRKRATRSPGRN